MPQGYKEEAEQLILQQMDSCIVTQEENDGGLPPERVCVQQESEMLEVTVNRHRKYDDIWEDFRFHVLIREPELSRLHALAAAYLECGTDDKRVMECERKWVLALMEKQLVQKKQTEFLEVILSLLGGGLLAKMLMNVSNGGMVGIIIGVTGLLLCTLCRSSASFSKVQNILRGTSAFLLLLSVGMLFM